MALSKDRIFKVADGYIRSGKIEKAVAEYEKWIGENPKDWNTIRQIGDLYARIGRNDQAIKKYTKIAEYYRSDGFNVRAIATYKMILRLSPQNESSMANLAELQVAQGLLMEAKSQYQALVELYSKTGKKRQASDVFKKLADIDPSDLKVRYKYAEFLERQGKGEESIAEYSGIADEFVNKGLVSEAIQIMEKGLRVDPANRSLRCRLAQSAIMQGDYPKAIKMLEDIRTKYPGDVELLTSLGEAYMGAGNSAEAEAVFVHLTELEPGNPDHASRMSELALGQDQFDKALDSINPAVDKMVSDGDSDKAGELLQRILNRDPYHVRTLVKLTEMYTILKHEPARISAYDKLCEAFAHIGDYEKAVHVAEQLIGLEPENSQHKDRLRFLKSQVAPPPVVEEPLSAEVGPALPDLEAVEAQGEFADAAHESGPSQFAFDEGDELGLQSEEEIEAATSLSPDDNEHINEKLTEAEVFVRYGLVDKAIDQLKDVLRRYRFHAGSREKLIEVYKDQGMNHEAAEQMVQLAHIYERLGQGAQAEGLLKDAGVLNPALTGQAGGPSTEEEIELTLASEDVEEPYDAGEGLVAEQRGAPLPSFASEGEPVSPFASEGEPVSSIASEGEPVSPFASEGEPVSPFASEGEPVPSIASEGEPVPSIASEGEPVPSIASEGEPGEHPEDLELIPESKEYPLEVDPARGEAFPGSSGGEFVAAVEESQATEGAQSTEPLQESYSDLGVDQSNPFAMDVSTEPEAGGGSVLAPQNEIREDVELTFVEEESAGSPLDEGTGGISMEVPEPSDEANN